MDLWRISRARSWSACLRRLRLARQRQLHVNASIGVWRCTLRSGTTPETLLVQADIEMYRMKRSHAASAIDGDDGGDTSGFGGLLKIRIWVPLTGWFASVLLLGSSGKLIGSDTCQRRPD